MRNRLIRTALLLACGPFLGCSAPLSSMPAIPPGRSVYPPPVSGKVSCEECRVHYFAGSALREAALSGGEYTIPAPARPFVLFVTGPRQAPHVTWVGEGKQHLPLVRLDPREELRGGLLAGVVVRAQSGGKARSSHLLTPVVNEEVVITLGRARQVVRSDAEGRFIVTLPANSYRIFVKGKVWDVTIPAGDTALLPIVVGRTVID